MTKLYEKIGIVIVAILVFASSNLLAQELNVSGKVTDDAGQPIPGASILEKGTTNGTVTDAQGHFALNVSSANATLSVSFIGYKAIDIPVNSRAVIDVQMVSDVTSLQEIVVTGYSSERKADVITAISQVSATNTVAIPQGDIGQAIQGRVAGVQVTTSGQPGAASQVRIRGFGSFTSNNPLYVIDGVPTFDNTQINPYDIESQTILKDAGASAIYGARAAAGVIVVTTKHGKYDGKTNVWADVNTGAAYPGNGQKNLNPQQQANAVYQAQTNTPGGSVAGQPYGSNLAAPQVPDYVNVGIPGGSPIGVFLSGPNQTPNGQTLINTALANYNINPANGQIIQVVKAAQGAGTDWYKALTHIAPTTRVSVGLSSGNDRAHVYANLTYYDQQGIAINTYLRRFSARLNSEFKPIKSVRIGENLMLTYRENPFLSGGSGTQGTNNGSGNPSDENAINLAYRMPTIIPVRDVNGGWAGTAPAGYGNPANPVANQTQLSPGYNQNVLTQAFGNMYIEIDPIKHLTLRSSFGGEVDATHALQLTQATYENAENTGSNTIAEASSFNLNYTFTNSLRYSNKFGNNSISFIGGYEAIKNNVGRYLGGSGLNPAVLDPNYISITNSSSTGRSVYSGPTTPYTFDSFFGKLDYNLSEKYYLSGSVRRDGSSVFGPQNRYGVFPSVSGGWRISSESFMSGVSWVSDLKLRGGYGTMGNSNALLYANSANQYTLYGGGPANGYDINGTNNSVQAGFFPLQVGNPAGKWETNATANVGLDGTFLNGTFDVILEVWQRKTTNVLFNPAFLNTGGVLGTNPFVNVGSMTNKGIDLQLIKRIKIDNDWSMTVDGNISPFKNTITQIANGEPFFEPAGGNIRGLQLVRNAVGQPMSSFYGYKMIGYFSSAADVTSSPVQSGAAPGFFKYANPSGTGTINTNDRQFIGSPIPKFTYGVNINVKYKQWFLTGFLYGVYGNKIMNFTKWYSDFYSTFSGAAMSADVLQAWTPALGNSAKAPQLNQLANFSTSSTTNSWYVESGSYARLKNLQLGYDIPKNMLTRLGMSRLRVYLQAINLFTITKYTGKDPEIVGNVDITRGIDVGNYPATRQYMVGLNLGF
jgi:TonB-dependent starch-binding outer membrane protein SusC